LAITRYYKQPLAITVKFSKNPLTPYNKEYSDIEDVSMNLKKNLATDLDDQYVEKKQSNTEVSVNESKHTFTMELLTTDYTNIEVGDILYLTVNVKVVGIADYIELPIDDRKVIISQDTNRA